MKSSLKIFLAALLAFQSVISKTYASEDYDDQNDDSVVCTSCVDRDAEPGDRVEVDGVTWELDRMGEVDGVSMWEGHVVGSGGTEGNSYGDGYENDPNDDRQEGHERITGHDFERYDEEQYRLSNDEKERLHELQAKIVERLNAETMADSAATVTELQNQYGSLDQAAIEGGKVVYQGPSVPTTPMDPMAALYDSLQVQLGTDNFYLNQAGWQLYDDHSYQSDHKEELSQLRDRLNHSIPQGPQQADAKRAGYYVLSEADQAYVDKDIALGDKLLANAKTLVDIATDILPITAAPKDFYRALIGKDPMTGAPLENWERALAAGFLIAGLATAGASNTLAPEIRAMAKAAKVAEEEVALAAKLGRTAEAQSSARNLAEKLKNSLTEIQLLNPVKENQKLIQNQGYTELAWNESKVVFSGKTKEEMKFVRFFSTNKVGRWVTDGEKLAGKTAEEIRGTLAMPTAPAYYTVVTVPPGTRISGGFVEANRWGGNTEAIQYFIHEIDPLYFGKEIKIKELFRGIK